MTARITSALSIKSATLQVTGLACFAAVVLPAHADPSMTSPLSPSAVARSIPHDASPAGTPLRVENGLETGVSATGDAGNSDIPRGNEMSVLAGVELERTDRRFRSRVVDWAMDRSVAAGLATDFILHGSPTGVHLRMQSRSEYVVRWETRF